MTYDMGNTDKLNTFRQELQKLRIPLPAPDINRSRRDFGVERTADGKMAIRYALAAVKYVGGAAIDALTAARDRDGPFHSPGGFADLAVPYPLNNCPLADLFLGGSFAVVPLHRADART